jgi:hypothetical protein
MALTSARGTRHPARTLARRVLLLLVTADDV